MASPDVQQQIDQYGLIIWQIMFPIVFIIITTFVLGLRVHVRLFMVKSWGIDDYLVIVAYTLFMALCGTCIQFHVLEKDHGVSDVYTLISTFVAAEVCYIMAQLAVKWALAAFFLRILTTCWQTKFILAAMITFSIYSLGFMLTSLLQCGTPTPEHFIIGHAQGQCLPWHTISILNYIFGALNALIDWLLTITPLLIILKLHITRHEKLIVSFLMLIGGIGSIVSLVRMAYVQGLRLRSDPWFFHAVIPISMCSIFETGLALIPLTLTACRPLYARVVGGVQERFSRGTEERKGSDGFVRFLEERPGKGFVYV